MTPRETIAACLRPLILAAFERAESVNNIEIPQSDKDFLLRYLPVHTEKMLDKFVAGAVEHHDSPFTELTITQQIENALAETIDLPNYLYAALLIIHSRRENSR